MKEKSESINCTAMDKYGDLVRIVVNDLDPIGVFPNAPEDHYEQEVEEIVKRLCHCESLSDIIETMYVVFAYKFTIHDAKPRHRLFSGAFRIRDSIDRIKE